MNIFNILATQITVFDTNLNNVPLTGVTKVVADVINFFSFGGYIAVGILLFSLILKIGLASELCELFALTLSS